MDDEDSQDELINKNISHGKGKRPNTSILFDEEEDDDDSNEEGTDSEEDDSQDGEEDEDEEDEIDEENSENVPEGAGGAEPTDLCLSSDEDAEKCAICLNSFHEQPVATPQNCEHYFCLECILEWAKNANSCPIDRIAFSNILLRKCYGGKVQKTITVQRPVTQEQEEQVNVDLEQTSCEVCGGTDREDRLLLCDGCDAGYHMECLTPPLDAVPVEEWFCPECAPTNRNRLSLTGAERLSEEEDRVLPTTSRSQAAGPRPTRAIARTQHSERVRANINRHRITQARTAAQLAPQYLMRSTWLDETINAVVAGLNTAVYVRDLTPRPRARRRRRKVRRKQAIKDGKDIKGKTSTTKVKRRRRKVRRAKSRKKSGVRKKTTTQGRIAQSLGLKKASRSSSIPSVYSPCEQTLGSMRADIGAASLSIYGSPFDLDPFDEEEETEQALVRPSLLEAKRQGLSRSALRSHQPVARPILSGLSSQGHSVPQGEEVAEAAPVPDLLGSILSGQSLLLMDSSDVVINRDGSLKAPKPACVSSPRRSISGSSASERSPSTGAADFHSSREPSCSPLTNSPQSFVWPASAPVTLSPSCPSTSSTPSSGLAQPRLSLPLPRWPTPTNSTGTGCSQWGRSSIRGQPPASVLNGDFPTGERQNATIVPEKKIPPKPVWVDVSVLPRIPKIKRENSSVANGSAGSKSNNLPESSITSLAGDKGQQGSVDQQGASEHRHSRHIHSQQQRVERAVLPSSFSNSFSSSTTSADVTSNSQSSSSISFRISSSGNPWHARRLSASDQALNAKEKGPVKRNQKDKQMLLSSYSQAKKVYEESEVYDPFNPTGSDASSSEEEKEKTELFLQRLPSTGQTDVQNKDAEHEIKAESMDLPVHNEMSEIKPQIKKEPNSSKDDSCATSSHQTPTMFAGQSESLASLGPYSGSSVVSDAEDSGNSERQLTKSLDHSRSGSLFNHNTDQKVKIELKTELAVDSSPLKSMSPVVSHVIKGNGFIHELSSISGRSAVNDQCKDKAIRSPCASSGEERQSQCASNICSLKTSEQSDKVKKHSRSEDRRQSHSRSPRQRRSRSRSRERDRRRSARSSSSESSRARRRKPEILDRDNGKERDGQKRSRKKRYSHSPSRSRSRSRSRERRSEQTFSRKSSRSLDRNKIRSKRKRSRSTSRDRRRREHVSEVPHQRERLINKNVAPTSAEENQPTCGFHRNPLLLKDESHTGQKEYDATLSIKKETDSGCLDNSKSKEDEKQIQEDVLSISVLHTSHESNTFEVNEERDSPLSNIKEFQVLEPKPVKVEQIWPDDDSSCSEDILVINLSPSGHAPCEKMMDCHPASLPAVEEMELELLQASCPIKKEPVDSSDEEINVDYLIDNLDFIKEEMKEEPVTYDPGVLDPQSETSKDSAQVKQEVESVLVMAGTKSKSQGKRVTWNIQEPVATQSDKMSKLALFKLKLKQEGFRKAASSSSMQTTGQVGATVQGGSKSASICISSPALEGRSNSGQEKSKFCKEDPLQNPDQKDKYMKKLHMQERAVEEVKLAIKPFYQKRDITKEEYKEILRKAVQKVCHSKSGEINPVKVANLVKAYVDKYKHARKHHKAEEKQTDQAPKDS